MKLTKIQAIEETVKIWKEIYENDLSCKPSTAFMYDCPCCEYVLQIASEECGVDILCAPFYTSNGSMCRKHCPLVDLWLEAQCSADIVMCRDLTSPYEQWLAGDVDTNQAISTFYNIHKDHELPLNLTTSQIGAYTIYLYASNLLSRVS